MRHVLKALLAVVLIVAIAGIYHPDTPLPDEWNPTTQLNINAPMSALTGAKLRRAMSSDELCLQVMARANAGFTREPDKRVSDVCHITPRITLRALSAAKLRPVETRCQTALRLAMWERHGLQAAAARHLDSAVREIRHYSSYNCRKIRTGSGNETRMSSHATADALDVSGFVLANGQTIDLKRDWTGNTAKSAFLRDAFKAACLWFPVALGPEFNALHADHFHLQTRGWGLCR